jgi:hypothetical protein
MTVSILCSSMPVKAATVTIDATNFPDQVFRDYVSATFDSDKDGSLNDAEIQNATSIEMKNSSYNGAECTDYTGVGYLTNLQKFSIDGDFVVKNGTFNLYGDVGPAALNFSSNTKLTNISASYTNLASITLPASVQNLNVSNCHLDTIDLSNCADLTYAGVNTNKLTALDISGCTSLETLHAEGNTIADNHLTLHTSDNTTLTNLWVSTNFNLTTMDVSHEIALVNLMMNGTDFTSGIDLSKNTNLETLYCYDAHLSALDLTKNANLNYVWCDASSSKNLILNSSTKLGGIKANASTVVGSTTETMTAEVTAASKITGIKNCEISMQAGSDAVNALSTENGITSAVGANFTFQDDSGNEVHQPQTSGDATLTMDLSSSGLGTPAADEEYVVYHKDGDTVTEVDGATVSSAKKATVPAASFTGYYVAVRKKNTAGTASRPAVQKTESNTDTSWCITYLDCSGNTVKVQWVKYGENASAPAGYSYPEVNHVTAHQDIRPLSCSVKGGYVVPNTADHTN